MVETAVAAIFEFIGEQAIYDAVGDAAYAALFAATEAAVTFALAYGVNKVAANQAKQKGQGGLINLSIDSDAPRQWLVGKRAIGGNLVDWYTDGTKNTVLYMPVYLSQGPCGTVTKIWAGGQVVLDTPLVHGVKTAIPDFRSPGDRLWVTYYDGRPGQTADPELVALDQGWGTGNKLTGCSYMVCKYQWDSDNMRSPIALTVEHEGAKLYDRRKDGTAGGSGTHRIKDPSTWELPDYAGGEDGANVAVALDHFRQGLYLSSSSPAAIGQGRPGTEWPYDRFAAQANLCDEDVTKSSVNGGGTQKRYRMSGVIAGDETYDTTILEMCKSMAARPADFMGRFGVIGPESKTPVMTIPDDDMPVGIAEPYVPKKSWSDLVTAVRGKFVDPGQLYQPNDYPMVSDDAWTAADGGDPHIVSYDFNYETDPERAQRLARIYAMIQRRQATLSGSYPLYAVELEQGDWFIRTGKRWGIDGKIFEVIQPVFDPATKTVQISSREVDPDDSAWTVDYAIAGPAPSASGPASFPAIAAPVLTVSEYNVVGTSFTRPGIKVAWTAPTDERIKWIYVTVQGSDGSKAMQTIANIPATLDFVTFTEGVSDGVEYSVQAKFMSDTISSPYATAILITPTGAFTIAGLSAEDIVAGLDTNSLTIAQEVLNNAAWRAGNDALLWIDGDTVGSVASSALSQAQDNAQSLVLLGARNSDDTAWILNADTVSIPPGTGGGSAISLRSLRTEHDQNVADVNFLVSSTGGVYAQATLTTNVDGFVTGFKFWNGGSPTNSGFTILASSFAIVDPGNGLSGPFIPFVVSGGTVKAHNMEVDTFKAASIVTDSLQDNSVTGVLVSTLTSPNSVNSSASYETQDSFSYTKAKAGSVLRIDYVMETVGTSSPDIQFDVKVSIGGVQVAEHHYYTRQPFTQTYANTVFVSGISAGASTILVEVKCNRSGIGASGFSVNNSSISVTEIKK